jgi:hypothetical protein
MKKKAAFLTVCVVTFGASAVSALEFSGATVMLEYRDNDGTDMDDQLHFEGSAALSFGSGIGLQFGLKQDTYKPDNFESFGYDIHATYDVTEQVTIGALYGREEFGTRFEYAGVEADFTFGQFGLQASVSRYRELDGGTFEAADSTLDASYDISDRFTLLAGYHHTDDGDGFSYGYLGGSARVFDGLDLTAKYGTLGGDFADGQDILSVGVSYSFKGGVIFKQRSYTNLFPSD